jgi:hypothetical protein
MRDDINASESEHKEEVRQTGSNDLSALKYIVSRHSQLNAEIKAAKFEQKELEDSAWEKCGKSAKAIRVLSKESAWDAVKREKQRQLEEEIDAGRVALGMLSDTPLGQAEMERMETEVRYSVTNPMIKAPVKRGRPKGSKNKPKTVPVHVE